jgi:hypothetical protein
MKTNQILVMSAAVICLTLGAVSDVTAQTTVVQTTTTRDIGTISEFSPDTIVIRPDKSEKPIRYVYSKATAYVDEEGVPVPVTTVRTGEPVTVEYERRGDQLVARRVVVRRSVTPNGTVIEKKTITTEKR